MCPPGTYIINGSKCVATCGLKYIHNLNSRICTNCYSTGCDHC